MPDSATQIFLAHRNLLFTIGYQILGSAADVEDVLQETWLRWVKVDLAQVVDQRAFLVRITTRLSLDRLRALKRRKESYIGPWLPEPLLTAPDVADDVELSNSVSMAIMLVLETLSPTERAVFVLREVSESSTTRSLQRSTRPPLPSGRLRIAPDNTSKRAVRARRSRPVRRGRRWSRSGGRSRRATSKLSSRCLLQTPS